MKRSDFEPLSYFNDEQRVAAADIYKIIEPNIIGEVPLPRISDETNIPLRTLQRWKKGYQKAGLSGLIRSPRSDSGSTKVDTTVQSLIENTRLKIDELVLLQFIGKSVFNVINKDCLFQATNKSTKLLKVCQTLSLNWLIMALNLIQKNTT